MLAVIAAVHAGANEFAAAATVATASVLVAAVPGAAAVGAAAVVDAVVAGDEAVWVEGVGVAVVHECWA